MSRETDRLSREMQKDLIGAPPAGTLRGRVVNAIPRSAGAAPAALPPLEVRDLQRMEYRAAWALQKRLVEQRLRDEIPDSLLLVEHAPVITTGRGTQDGFLRQARFDVVEVERGGQATYHGPGQIVAYPIVRLTAGRRDLHAWMRALEEASIRALADFGLLAGRCAGATGVWIDGVRKIASIGVAATRWVTFHGLALNHEPDLSHFAAINPCGFDAAVMTSARAELGERCPDRAALAAALVAHLQAELQGFREGSVTAWDARAEAPRPARAPRPQPPRP